MPTRPGTGAPLRVPVTWTEERRNLLARIHDLREQLLARTAERNALRVALRAQHAVLEELAAARPEATSTPPQGEGQTP